MEFRLFWLEGAEKGPLSEVNDSDTIPGRTIARSVGLEVNVKTELLLLNHTQKCSRINKDATKSIIELARYSGLNLSLNKHLLGFTY